MKKCLLFSCTLFLYLFSTAQTPVAWYPFSGNANDAVGTLNGIVNGGASLTTDRFGNANSAYSFDGIDDAISFAALPMTNTDNFSLLAWVNPAIFEPGNQFNKMIISLGPGTDGYNMGMGNNNAGGGGNQLGGLYNLVSWLPSGAFLNTINTWYHVAMVRENGVTKFYLNGVQAPNTFNPSPNAFTTAFQIGGQDFDPTHFWNGKIDEVKIYNVGLTAAQVLNEFNNSAQSPIPVNALQLWLKGDDGITKDVNNKVSAWADQSAAGRLVNQSISTSQPVWVDHVINGHAVVRFATGVSDFLSTNYRGPNTDEVTIFVVAQGSNISSVVRFQNVQPPTSGYLIYGYTHRGASNGFCMSNDGGDFNGIDCGFFNNSALQIGTARWKANTANGMQTFINGALLAQRTSSASTLPNDTLQIGTGGAVDESIVGDVAEIIIYDRALSDAEKAQVENYLNIKYRVTDHLAASKPGSGNAISFDGFDDDVEVPNSTSLQFPGDFSAECWVKIAPIQNNVANPDNAILEKWGGSNSSIGYPFVLRYYKVSHSAFLARYDGVNSRGIEGITIVDDNKWHHIIGTKTGDSLKFYIDGILQGATLDFTDLSNVNNNQNLNIGTRGPIAVTPNNLTGQIDEVRLWNVGMTEAQIRDRMCHKITIDDPLYSNLVAYYNFDESAGNIVFDGSLNGNNGALSNNPTRLISGAAIGNVSSHSYAGAASTTTVTNPNRGDALTATLTSGAAEGIQVYGVTEAPNTTQGQNVLSGNDGYFGVFTINGNAPQYHASYNYSGINSNGIPEIRLAPYKRADNTGASWNRAIAVIDSNANTYNMDGQSSEYMMGISDSKQEYKPGSGNTISFDGASKSVDIPNSAAINFGTGEFSVDFWYNSVDNGRAEIIFEKRDDNCGDGQNWAVRKSANQVYMEINVPGPTSDVVVIPNAGDGKWHHLVFTRTVTAMAAYQDGMLMATTAAATQNVSNTAMLQIGNGPCSPFFPGGGGFFNGSIDELRFWNTALTQAQIRDRMCRKITAADPLFANLAAYYNFDESAGDAVFDGSVFGNNGTIVNNPARVTSGAAIGNQSTHDYVNAIKAASITHPDGENFTATSTAGSPDGIQVYLVTEQPNTLLGTSGVGANDKYVGVFQVNGSSPQYSAVYNYDGNPLVIAADESSLRLNTRADNAGTNWTMLTNLPDETANSITVADSNAEFILGKLGNPLPVRLVSFAGNKQNETVQLHWQTTNELNLAQFEIERSNGSNGFIKIVTVPQVSVSVSNEYAFTDMSPFVSGTLQYYRLKIVDKSGRFVYSNIIHFANNGAVALTVFPNPVKNIVTIVSGKKQEAVISNATGQLISKIILNSGSQALDCSGLPAGVYFVRVEGEVVKFVKE